MLAIVENFSRLKPASQNRQKHFQNYSFPEKILHNKALKLHFVEQIKNYIVYKTVVRTIFGTHLTVKYIF